MFATYNYDILLVYMYGGVQSRLLLYEVYGADYHLSEWCRQDAGVVHLKQFDKML